MSYIFIAEMEGTAIAADNFGCYKNSTLYWTGVSNDTSFLNQANSLLHWTAMMWMKDRGIHLFESKRRGFASGSGRQ